MSLITKKEEGCTRYTQVQKSEFYQFNRQIRRFAKIWPQLDFRPAIKFYQRYLRGEFSVWLETQTPFLVLPRWQRLSSTYQEAVRIVLEKINPNWQNGNDDFESLEPFDLERLYEMPDKVAAIEELGALLPDGDCLVVPLRKRGSAGSYSMYWARRLFQDECEQKYSRPSMGYLFGLGVFEIGMCWLLLHDQDSGPMDNRMNEDDTDCFPCLGDVYVTKGGLTSPAFLRDKQYPVALGQESERYSDRITRYGCTDPILLGCRS